MTDNETKMIRNLSSEKTGDQLNFQSYHIKSVKFGKYIVELIVNGDNQFIGIQEIKVNKDFLSLEQKLSQNGYHDVDEFYQD